MDSGGTHIVQKPNRHNRHTSIIRFSQYFSVQINGIPSILGMPPGDTAAREVVRNFAGVLAQLEAPIVEERVICQGSDDADGHMRVSVMRQKGRSRYRRVCGWVVDIDGEEICVRRRGGQHECAGIAANVSLPFVRAKDGSLLDVAEEVSVNYDVFSVGKTYHGLHQ